MKKDDDEVNLWKILDWIWEIKNLLIIYGGLYVTDKFFDLKIFDRFFDKLLKML